MKQKCRLDDRLVDLGYFSSRDEALRAVLAHEVKVNDVFASGAAISVTPDDAITVKDRKKFVSRGGHKLQGALQAFAQDVSGLRCCDVGASTGGFTDCLLQAGAESVACVDVNYGQLAWEIRQNPRVRVFERTNIKNASVEELGGLFDMVVADVSFIGLAGLSSVFARLLRPEGIFIGLIKPQFESAHDETDHGVVTDPAVRQRTIVEVVQSLCDVGFEVTGVVESALRGPEGNVEYLVRAVFSS